MGPHTHQRLRKGFGVIAGLVFGVIGAGGPDGVITATRGLIDFALQGTAWKAADWIAPANLALPVRALFLLSAVAIIVWAFWPARKPKAPVLIATPRNGSYIVGGRAEDEAGVTIGPMPIAEALKVWARPDSEYVPLNEAGQWLYDNGEPWLKDRLKEPEPFKSITEHAAALVGSACDSGAGALVASLEPGLKPEPVKWKDLHHNAFDAMFNADKKLPVNPLVRRSDLPSILAFYKNPIPPDEPIKVRRDAPLREALMFAVTGSWGSNPWADGEGHLPAVSAAIERTRQLAADGSIVVWGKATNHGVWQRIEPAYWVNHYIDLFDVLRRETRTRAYNTLTNEPLFIDLMVSRAEFEAEWPEP